MAVAVEGAASAAGGQVLVVFNEEGDAALDEGQVFVDVGAGILLLVEHHSAKFQDGIPFVFEPGVVLQTFVVVGWSVPAVFGGVGEAEVLELFGEAGAGVSPVCPGAQFGCA